MDENGHDNLSESTFIFGNEQQMDENGQTLLLVEDNGNGVEVSEIAFKEGWKEEEEQPIGRLVLRSRAEFGVVGSRFQLPGSQEEDDVRGSNVAGDGKEEFEEQDRSMFLSESAQNMKVEFAVPGPKKGDDVGGPNVEGDGVSLCKDEFEEQDKAKSLSKSAQKYIMKVERYKEKKMQWKAREKKQRHQETERKRRESQEKMASLSVEERAKAMQAKLDLRKVRKEEQNEKKEKIRRAMENGQNLVIDLEFCDLMKPNEISSLIQQVMYSYAANRRAAFPSRLSLTGCNGEILKELSKISGFDNWLILKEERSYLELFDDRKADLVYLTADAEKVLDSLDASKIYIVGGLVDHNRWKLITLQKATQQRIATARLPIGDHLKMLGSQVLTVNQVMELLLHYLEVKDWKGALSKAVPQRKRALDEVENGSEKL